MTEHPTDATVTPAMIEAGVEAYMAASAAVGTDEMIGAIYLAMNAARTTSIDDEGLPIEQRIGSMTYLTGHDLNADREGLGDPQDWKDKLEELYGWTGSTWAEEQPEAYSFMCSLIGYLIAGEKAASKPNVS